MRTIIIWVGLVLLLFTGAQLLIAGIFKIKPLDDEARAVVSRMKSGFYQYDGFIIFNPEEIYTYRFIHGELQIQRVRSLPSYLNMPKLWDEKDD